MSNPHNKKRNVGIIYEQLLQRAAAALVDNDTRTVELCTSIIKKYYKPGTEIFKEFRLFQALLNTTIKSEALSLRIIQEAKRGVHMFSQHQIDIEKSLMIRDINKRLNEPNFFNLPIKEYRLYATLQTLMNDWRKEDETSLTRIVEYEQKLLEWLSSDKNITPSLNELTTKDVSSLSVKLMNEKFEKKWGGKLSELQRSLIKDYIHGKVDNEMLETIKNRAVRGLSRLRESASNSVILEKLDEVVERTKHIDARTLDDAGIIKFMHLTQLFQELESKDE